MSKFPHNKLVRWNLDDPITHVRDLPVLGRWLERAAQEQPLRGVTALMLQHQLSNQVAQTEALIHLGLDPKAIHWIDIPYTSHAEVRQALTSMGIPEENLRTGSYRLLDDYAPYQRLRVQQFIRELSASPPDHLLVLDDGSYFLEALACQKRSIPRISIVEQTTRGLIKIEENAALEALADDVPLVNVARSGPKTILEPPFIGVAVCDALLRRLQGRIHAGPRDKCLLLGYGAIGAQVAAFANRFLGFDRDRIFVFDSVEARMHQARADGYGLFDRHERGQRFTLVLGCSGRGSFKVGDHVLLEDGAHLVSATSGTVELSREHFIELAEASPHDDIWIERGNLDETDLHSDIEFHFVDRQAVFVNGGFPVNFDGRHTCVPGHYIQPTPTMMCAAAVQAVQTTGRGLLELDDAFCSWVSDDFAEELGHEAHLVRSGE
jgi:S-adenosylhomocysteine hydrolase